MVCFLHVVFVRSLEFRIPAACFPTTPRVRHPVAVTLDHRRPERAVRVSRSGRPRAQPRLVPREQIREKLGRLCTEL